MTPRRSWTGVASVVGALLVVLPTAAAILLALFALLELLPKRRVRFGPEVAPSDTRTMFPLLLGRAWPLRNNQALWLGILVAILATLLLTHAERERSRVLWPDGTTPDISAILTGVSTLDGSSPGWTRNGIRLTSKNWVVPRGVEALELSLEMRSLTSMTGWQWYTNHADTFQERRHEEGVPFTRLHNVKASIVRRYMLPESVANRRFRATVEMRSPLPIVLEGCDGLELRTSGEYSSACETISLSDSWSTYTVAHTFPSDSEQPALDLSLGPIATPHVDIRGVRVEEWAAGDWRPIGIGEPAGVTIRVPQPQLHYFGQPVLSVVPVKEWRTYVLPVESDSYEWRPTFSALLQVEAGNQIEVRNVQLREAGTLSRELVATPTTRPSLFHGHPNILGHTLAASGTLGALLAPSAATALITCVVALGVVIAVGSRTAALSLLLVSAAIALFWLLRQRRRRAQLAALLGAISASVMLVLLSTSAGAVLLGRLTPFYSSDVNQVGRLEIWSTATEAILQRPWQGWGADGFNEAWSELKPGDQRATPDHAHNLWLHAGVSYGVPGLAIAIIATGIVLALFIRGGRAGHIYLGALILLQVFDSTLTNAGVWTSAVLALLALRRGTQNVARQAQEAADAPN